MTVDRIELILLQMPYRHFFETSFGREINKTFILVKVFSQGIIGYGEVTADRLPLYSCETNSTAWSVLKELFIPMLFERKLEEPEDFIQAAAVYKGHPMAKAGLENALWDIKAKKAGISLSRLYGASRIEIPAGVSIGIQDEIRQLVDRVREFQSLGYLRFKLKIKPGWDIDAVAAVREAFPDAPLQVDANAAYTIADLDKLRKLDEYHLLMLEQPFSGEDLWDHRRLQKEIKTPVCLDESITSADSARRAWEMESARIINIKVGRVGGIRESRRIHGFCREKKIPVWCGGMLESGIGRAHNIHLAALPNFLFPNDISASRRYFETDLVEPSFEMTSRGTIPVPEGPGIGVSPQEDRIRAAELQRQVFT
jgi:o-succinylbenzoate synthase